MQRRMKQQIEAAGGVDQGEAPVSPSYNEVELESKYNTTARTGRTEKVEELE